MPNLRKHFQFSVISICSSVAATGAVIYIGLIAVVMSYAVLTVEYSQSVKDNEAVVAVLEGEYLASLSRIESMDYLVAGYVKPVVKTFVPATSATALR